MDLEHENHIRQTNGIVQKVGVIQMYDSSYEYDAHSVQHAAHSEQRVRARAAEASGERRRRAMQQVSTTQVSDESTGMCRED